MGNGNRAADDERDVESVEKLFTIDSNLRALLDVISDAVVAAKHRGGDESHQLLGALIERAVLVRLRVECKESFDAQMVATKQFLVHRRAIAVKLIHTCAFHIEFRSHCTIHVHPCKSAANI